MKAKCFIIAFKFLFPLINAINEINIAGFLPFYHHQSDHYNVIKKVTDVALNKINLSPSILPKYKLNIIWNDSKVIKQSYN